MKFIIFNDSDTNILYNVTDLKYDYYFSFFDKVSFMDFRKVMVECVNCSIFIG